MYGKWEGGLQSEEIVLDVISATLSRQIYSLELPHCLSCPACEILYATSQNLYCEINSLQVLSLLGSKYNELAYSTAKLMKIRQLDAQNYTKIPHKPDLPIIKSGSLTL
jgi:hypothetical protein